MENIVKHKHKNNHNTHKINQEERKKERNRERNRERKKEKNVPCLDQLQVKNLILQIVVRYHLECNLLHLLVIRHMDDEQPRAVEQTKKKFT